MKVRDLSLVAIALFSSCASSETLSESKARNLVRSQECPNVFQPSLEHMEAIEQTSLARDALQSPKRNEIFGNDQPFILIGDLPYYKYWLSDGSEYRFHPMAAGRFVQMLDDPGQRKKTIDRLLSIAQRLPNGGLAWYYSEGYTTNRLKGPGVSYSAISQAEILSGLLKGWQEGNVKDSVLRDVFRSFELDYCDGGVLWSPFPDRDALLEFPLFGMAPEIILNGWVHALLHIVDYYTLTKDEAAKDLLHSNVRYLSEILGVYDDPESALSRYSNLSPYAVDTEGDIDSLHVVYSVDDRSHGLKPLHPKTFTFHLLEKGSRPNAPSEANAISPYDTQVVKQGAGAVRAWIGCSPSWTTRLISDAPFSVRLAAGRYRPNSSTPGSGGVVMEIKAAEETGRFVATLPNGLPLICGYPTNFAKKGQINFYHVYHVVALAYLAKVAPFPDEAMKSRVLDIVRRWSSYRASSLHGTFTEPAKVLSQINSGKVLHQVGSLEELEAELGVPIAFGD
jgi:hypothetical protein